MLHTCKNCGKEFKSGWTKRQFCSRGCSNQKQPRRKKTGRQIECVTCGRPFYCGPKRLLVAKFCSIPCNPKLFKKQSSLPATKRCWICGHRFPRERTNFYRNARSHDGLASSCIHCMRETVEASARRRRKVADAIRRFRFMTRLFLTPYKDFCMRHNCMEPANQRNLCKRHAQQAWKKNPHRLALSMQRKAILHNFNWKPAMSMDEWTMDTRQGLPIAVVSRPTDRR